MERTPDIEDRIIAFVKGGAAPSTAAAACNVPREVLDDWMTDLKFFERINLAMKEARLLAEIDLRRKAPGTWLSRNPLTRHQAGQTAKRPAKVKGKRFSLRQEKFIREYCVDGNGTRAAIRAGYAPKTANVKASQLLTKINISYAIEAYRAKALARTDITVDRLLREVASIAFNNPKKLFDGQTAARCR
jgi:hypothetical protein